jgi:hypothetical protein
MSIKSIEFLDNAERGLLASLIVSGPMHAHLIAPIPFDGVASNAEVRPRSGARCCSAKRFSLS